MTEQFSGSAQPSLGVEWEVAFVDRRTRDTAPAAAEVLDIIDAEHPGHGLQREFLANTVELVTGVHMNVPDAVAELQSQLDMVLDAADRVGVDVWSSGSHPFARGTAQQVSAKGHYSEIINRTQWWGNQMIIWGVHVHVGIKDSERVWPIIQALATKLPHMLALSASSPAWNGEDMGYASNRSLLYQQLPTAGQPPAIYTWPEWESYMHDQSRSGVINHTGSMHLDIRPASKYGTIEVRVADATSNLQELAAIVALTHCLTVYYDRMWEAGEELPSLQSWHIAENKWRAARYGMDALVVVNRDTDERWVRDELRELVAQLAPLADELGCRAELEFVNTIVEMGAAYERQRTVADAAGALPSMATEDDVRANEQRIGHTPWRAAVDLAVQELRAGRPIAPADFHEQVSD